MFPLTISEKNSKILSVQLVSADTMSGIFKSDKDNFECFFVLSRIESVTAFTKKLTSYRYEWCLRPTVILSLNNRHLLNLWDLLC